MDKSVFLSVSIFLASGLVLCLVSMTLLISLGVSLSPWSLFSVSVSHYLLAPKDRILQSLIQVELGSGPRECLLYLQFLLIDLGAGKGEWGRGAAVGYGPSPLLGQRRPSAEGSGAVSPSTHAAASLVSCC